jgi:hypothetical protein
MRDCLGSIDRNVYMTPEPTAVAQIYASHGAEAAETRWHWIDPRTLGTLARTGRALLGQGPVIRRARATTPMQEAVGIEAGYILGSRTAGQRAAWMRTDGLTPVEQERGLVDMPKISNAERGRRLSLSAAARNGDAAAASEVEAIADHELAVGRVLQLALGLVPEQPPLGRYVLPEASAHLAELLADHPRAAVLAVFPALADPPFATPVPVQPESPAMPTPTVAKGRERRVPSDAEIRAAHAETPRAPDLAERWGVSVAAVYTHLRRLGLTRPAWGRGLDAKPVAPVQPETNVVPFSAPVPPTDSRALTVEAAPAAEAPIQVYSTPARGEPAFRGRLDVEALALAVELSRRTGLAPQAAISWVRADLAEAAIASAVA